MTNLSPDFDVERRRRWYAVCLGAICALTFMLATFLTSLSKLRQIENLNLTIEYFGIIFGVWVFFFLLKFVAGYAVWYSPYNSIRRAITLSVLAIFTVYVVIFGAEFVFSLISQPRKPFAGFIREFIEFQISIYGLPYIAAAFVGWCFARSLPDVREQF
ncbi:MAG: hypothetical protein ABJN22_11040 [Litorimonas sp.]